MPSPQSYQYYYSQGTSDPANPANAVFTLSAPTAVENTVTDSEDASLDDTTAVGGALDWSAAGFPTTFYGYTDSGDPILQVTVYGDDYFYILSDNGSLSGTSFTFSNTQPYMYCFAAGTMIATDNGEVAVETLRTGDSVRTSDGAVTAVKWIGRQTMVPMFAGARCQPVRIRAGALGHGLPHSDLTVTADHGMVFYPSSGETVEETTQDGLVINASALVNGGAIDWLPMAELPDRFTVYHIETAAHDVILANGAAAETFIDYAGRRQFDNYAEYIALYGDDRVVAENPLPRISAARLVPPAIRQRIAGHSGIRQAI